MITYKKFISFLIPWIALALIMNLTRFAMTDIHSYIYMNWNLFLGFFPLFLIFLFEKINNTYLKSFYFLVWLFFLPNSVYMLTDFIHLRDVGPDWMLWFDAMMLFSYALIGIFISAYVLLRMKKNLFDNNKKQNIFIISVSVISSLGIYLGRYVRLNSWDVLVHPINSIKNIFNIILIEYIDPIFVFTIIFFSLFILVSTESLKKVFEK